MGQITLTIDNDVENTIKQYAHAENLPPSLWLSQFIEQQIKPHQDWSPEIKALSGCWADFPSLEEIRKSNNLDCQREPL